MKAVKFYGDTDKKLKNWPRKILERFAYSLKALSFSMRPSLEVKSLSGLGVKVKELKKNGKPAYRLVFVECDNYIHVLHVYLKTSDGTDSKHKKLISKRLKDME